MTLKIYCWGWISLAMLGPSAFAEPMDCGRILNRPTPRLSRQEIKKYAVWPVDIEAIRRLAPDDQARALARALNSRFKRSRWNAGLGRNYQTYLAQVRDAGYTNLQVLALMRKGLNYHHSFSLDREFIASLGLRADEVWSTFNDVSYLDGVLALRSLNVFEILTPAQKTALVSKVVARVNGLNLIHGARLLDPSADSQKRYLRSVLAQRQARLPNFAIRELEHYLSAPEWSSNSRREFLEILLDRHEQQLVDLVTKLSTALPLELTDRRSLGDRLLSEVSADQLSRIDPHYEFSDGAALRAFQRILKSHSYPLPLKLLMDLGPKFLKRKAERLAFLKDLFSRTRGYALDDPQIANFELTAQELWPLALNEAVGADLTEEKTQNFLRALPALADIPGLTQRLKLAAQPRKHLRLEVMERFNVNELKTRLRSFAADHPTSVALHEAELPWDRVHRLETGLKLLRYALVSSTGEEAELTDSLQIISKILFGRVVEEFVNVGAGLSSDTLSALYELTLDFASPTHAQSVFEDGLRFDQGLWKKSRVPLFIELLTLVRDWKLVTQQGTFPPDVTGHVIDDANILPTIERMRGAIIAQIGVLIGPGATAFDFSKFRQLQELWGSLEPVFTLLARYSGFDGWKKEIPTLFRIFNTSLEGTFRTYKYFGYPGDEFDQALARQQLAPLSDNDSVKFWTENYAHASLFNDSAAHPIDKEATSRAAQLIIDTNIKLHFNLEPTDEMPTLGKLLAEALISGSLQRVPELVAEAIPREPQGGPDSLGDKKILHALVLAMIQNGDPAHRLQIARFLLDNARDLPIDEQQQEDLQALIEVYEPAQRRGRVEIVATTTFDDPKSLLIIGDLVKTSSCQNYRSGGFAHTLPSYVIDANIKGLASFSLREKHFVTPADFQRVKHALERNLLKLTVYNGEQRSFTFTHRDGTSISSLPLGHAYLRHILRLGQTATNQSAVPALFLERPYSQNHPALELMRNQTDQIVAELATNLGAKLGGRITFARSRNPAGGYTDAGKGVKQSGFVIEAAE